LGKSIERRLGKKKTSAAEEGKTRKGEKRKVDEHLKIHGRSKNAGGKRLMEKKTGRLLPD